MTRYFIAAAVTLLIALGLYKWGYLSGWSTRDAEMQIEIAKANEEARTIERTMNEKLNSTSVQLKEANNVIDEKSSALSRAIAAGRVRLPAPSCVQAAPAPAAPSGDRNEASSQPDPAPVGPSDAERETLQLIAQIAADGDRAINQLNACIDAYNQVRSQINGDR